MCADEKVKAGTGRLLQCSELELVVVEMTDLREVWQITDINLIY